MGAAMAANLARAGYPLTVWNRTPGRAAELRKLGAKEGDHPAEVAAASDVVAICVSDSPDVEAVKAVNQVILAGTYLGVAEGIILAMKSGLDVEQVVEALGGGAAQSWVLANRSGRMIANDYPLGFKTSLHRKDLGIALALAAEVGATLPVAALCAQLETGLVTQGHGDDDMSAVARTIRELSGL